MKKLKIEKRGPKDYWVENIDTTQYLWCGPYKNREEAVEAREGLQRTRDTKVWQEIERTWVKSSSKPSSEAALPTAKAVVTTCSTASEKPVTQLQSSSLGSKSLISGFSFGLASKPPTPQ